MISGFTGNFRFLSNFWKCQICYDGHVFSSVECAYQYAKCASEEDKFRLLTAKDDSFKAKKLGRTVEIRSDWEDVKYDIMLDLVRQKFRSFSLGLLLTSTGQEELVESNTWHDNLWGNCECAGCEDITGKNWLGKILMTVREELLDGTN